MIDEKGMTETKIGKLTLDSSFLKRIQKGEEEAIVALYDASFSVLMNVVVRYKSNREDQVTLIHNTFMKALNHLSDFNIGTSFIAWIKTILQREIIDDFRRNKRHYLQVSLELVAETGHEPDFDEMLDFPTEMVNVKELLSKLPTATRTVFNLFLWDDFSPSEIAKELGISIDTVRWHIKMARKLIRQQIEKP